MSINEKLLMEAKEQFYKEFKDRIEDMGYHLAHEMTRVEGIRAIHAKIHDIDNNGFPRGTMGQLEDILPETYSFKGKEIPVKINYFIQVRVFCSCPPLLQAPLVP